MGNLRTGHIVEVVIWLSLCGLLYAYSFEFDGEIEIYKFGASAWPRTILLLIAVAAIGQFVFHMKEGDGEASSMMGKAHDEGLENQGTGLKWYLWTFFLVSLPFIYMNLPEVIASAMSLEKSGLHATKLIVALAIVALFIFTIGTNHVGGMLALPILFASFLQDYGFYAMAPLFILSVMFLFGERRYKRMITICLGLYLILLLFFVSLLYVGLPTGNIGWFYTFGTSLVNIMQ